jgi:hypothetical protein
MLRLGVNAALLTPSFSNSGIGDRLITRLLHGQVGCLEVFSSVPLPFSARWLLVRCRFDFYRMNRVIFGAALLLISLAGTGAEVSGTCKNPATHW